MVDFEKFKLIYKRYWNTFFIIAIPLFLAFIFLIKEPNNLCDTKDAQNNCIGQTRVVPFSYSLLWMAGYWITGVVDISATALMPMILFPLFGIMSAGTVAPQYMKDVAMLFIGGLIFATAIEKTNLHRRLALKILMVVGTTPHALMAGFQICTWFLSMWISNTATTAMICR